MQEPSIAKSDQTIAQPVAQRALVEIESGKHSELGAAEIPASLPTNQFLATIRTLQQADLAFLLGDETTHDRAPKTTALIFRLCRAVLDLNLLNCTKGRILEEYSGILKPIIEDSLSKGKDEELRERSRLKSIVLRYAAEPKELLRPDPTALKQIGLKILGEITCGITIQTNPESLATVYASSTTGRLLVVAPDRGKMRVSQKVASDRRPETVQQLCAEHLAAHPKTPPASGSGKQTVGPAETAELNTSVHPERTSKPSLKDLWLEGEADLLRRIGLIEADLISLSSANLSTELCAPILEAGATLRKSVFKRCSNPERWQTPELEDGILSGTSEFLANFQTPHSVKPRDIECYQIRSTLMLTIAREVPRIVALTRDVGGVERALALAQKLQELIDAHHQDESLLLAKLREPPAPAPVVALQAPAIPIILAPTATTTPVASPTSGTSKPEKPQPITARRDNRAPQRPNPDEEMTRSWAKALEGIRQAGDIFVAAAGMDKNVSMRAATEKLVRRTLERLEALQGESSTAKAWEGLYFDEIITARLNELNQIALTIEARGCSPATVKAAQRFEERVLKEALTCLHLECGYRSNIEIAKNRITTWRDQLLARLEISANLERVEQVATKAIQRGTIKLREVWLKDLLTSSARMDQRFGSHDTPIWVAFGEGCINQLEFSSITLARTWATNDLFERESYDREMETVFELYNTATIPFEEKELAKELEAVKMAVNVKARAFAREVAITAIALLKEVAQAAGKSEQLAPYAKQWIEKVKALR